jgi:large subunit ribosomal protein L19
MSNVIDQLERAQLRKVPRFKAGDTVRVHFKVIEGQRQRIQVFEGIVLKKQGSGMNESFTVRKQSFGVGVERTFPLHSPKIDKIEVSQIGDVHRAKLYYLREKVGKRARVRELRPGEARDRAEAAAVTPEAEPVVEEPEAVEEAEPEAVAESPAEDEAAPEEPAAEAEAEEPAAESEAEEPAAEAEPEPVKAK